LIDKAHKQAIVSLVGDYAFLRKIKTKIANLISIAIIKAMKPLSKKIKTQTFDIGKEFAEHTSIDQVLRLISYFECPYASWQCGSNEWSAPRLTGQEAV
jgi:IS30 family transposase